MNKLYLVESISVTRHRYVIEDENPDYALDTFVMDYDSLIEVSHHHLSEDINHVAEITQEDYLDLFDKDNSDSYVRNWSEIQKMSLIHRRKET